MRDTLALAGPLVFAAIASVFAAFVYFLSAFGSGATESMPIAGPHAALCVALGLLVPVVSFGALDACYSADDWFFLLGIMAAKKGTSSEIVHAHRFVRQPWNAHTSHAFHAAGLLVLDAHGARAPICTIFLGAALLALGTASYVWWASGRQRARDLDHTFMEAHVLGVALVALSIAHPRWDGALAAAGCAFTLVRARALAGADARIISGMVALFACVAHAAVAVGGAGDLRRLAAALTICLGGLVVKAADALGWSQFSWGTAVFHYTSAAQCALLFFYLQTLPKPVA